MAAESIKDIMARMNLPTPVTPESPPPSTPGCEPWCHGEGSRRLPTPHRPWVDIVPTYLEVMRAIRYEYCPCSAGDDARERHRAALSALETVATQKTVERLWNAADLPTMLRGYTFESYLALPDARPDLVEKLRRWQAGGHDSRRFRRWLLLGGPKGTYKTSLAVSLLQEHLSAGRSGLFVTAPSFLARIRRTFSADRNADAAVADAYEVMASAIGVDLLVLDDVGANTITPWVQEQFYTLINERDIWDRPTIITTNLDLFELEEHLGYRTFDRVRGKCCIDGEETFAIRLSGESRRGRAWTGGTL